MREQFVNRSVNSQRNYSVGSNRSFWSTTNQEFFTPKAAKDYPSYRKNFKRKTPFTQWSNAYFSNGVFFNPPVSGI